MPLYVILSEGRHECRPKSNFYRVSNEVKARAVRRSGIWLKISVAFYTMLHLLWQATGTPCHIPSSHSLLGFAPFFTPQNFDFRLRPSLRMTYRNFI